MGFFFLGGLANKLPVSVYHEKNLFFFFLTVTLVESAMIIFRILVAKYFIERLKVLV